MKRTIFLSMLAGISGIGVAQDQPFATGPSHPLRAILPQSSPFAKLSSRHLNAIPLPMDKYAEGKGFVVNPHPERGVEMDLTNRTQRELILDALYQKASSNLLPQGSAGKNGSVPGVAEEHGQMKPNTIFGGDDRTVVSNVTAYPWRTMCKIYIQFPDRSRFVASGTLIGNRYMQTSGQCVYNASHGGWAYSIEVVPGQYGNYRPYGSAWATKMRTYNGWIYNKDREYDLAVVTLDRNIGNSTGYLGYAYVSNLNGYTGNLGAYDADRYNGMDLLYRYGNLWGDEGTGIYYYMDTAPGAAGGGVYVIINGGRYVVASNGWQSSTWNFGTKINRQRFYDIQGWLASGN